MRKSRELCGERTRADKPPSYQIRGPRKTRCFYAFPSCQVDDAVILKQKAGFFARSIRIIFDFQIFNSFLLFSRPPGPYFLLSFNPPVESRADYAP